MISIITSYIGAAINMVATNPIPSIYLGLGVIHLVITSCYLRHLDGRILAICAGLTSVLYFLLARQYGFAQ